MEAVGPSEPDVNMGPCIFAMKPRRNLVAGNRIPDSWLSGSASPTITAVSFSQTSMIAVVCV